MDKMVNLKINGKQVRARAGQTVLEAAKAAGMRCVGVTHSCPRERLREADLVVDDLAGVDLAAILDGGEHP